MAVRIVRLGSPRVEGKGEARCHRSVLRELLLAAGAEIVR